MLYSVGLLVCGIALLGATAFPSLWHNSLEHSLSTVLRFLSLLVGLACLIISVHALIF